MSGPPVIDKANDKFAERLKQSQTAHRELEQRYQQEVGAMQRLLQKLSQACKGHNKELDNRLAELRQLLAKNPSVERLKQTQAAIEQQLQEHDKLVTQQMRDSQNTLIASGKALQGQRGLSDELRRQLRAVLGRVAEPHTSYLTLLPQFRLLCDLYQQALQQVAGHGAESAELPRIRNQLLALFEQIDVDEQHQSDAANLKKLIGTATDAEQLLGHCIALMQIVLKLIEQERLAAETFLANLNETLAEVHNRLNHSLDTSKDIEARDRELQQQLQQQLSRLGDDVDQATDLNSLKSSIRAHLAEIIDALGSQDAIRSEQTQVHQSMETLQHRVAELEQEASGFQARLSEQRQRLYEDPLTKLPNRAAFDERLQIEYQRWKRYGGALTIAVMDLDHFKQINDTFGHIAGDRTLQIVAKVLDKGLRQSDFVARYGGEEFVMMFPELDKNAVHHPLEKLRKLISQLPLKFKDQQISVTASIGAATFQPDESTEQAFERADQALYKAKHEGRNRIAIAQ